MTTTAEEPTGAALLAQIRRVAAQANHFDGLLDELPSRASGLRGVDFGEDRTDLTRSPP
ncbi:MAG: hypothetical protein MUE46_18430 [Xanthomonadales bacterium]|jgi:hypothetical protein|nr:hypothetical protein [Xanthomonadales bacterium]